MTRRTFSRAFKIEASKLVTERGVSVAQACRDPGPAESVLRRWMRSTSLRNLSRTASSRMASVMHAREVDPVGVRERSVISAAEHPPRRAVPPVVER